MCGAVRRRQRHARPSVIEAITTNETTFFRDSIQFGALKTALIPDLIKRRNHARALRFWSAACSSGQEPYSLAMLLREMNLGDWELEILATDLSQEMLERAQRILNPSPSSSISGSGCIPESSSRRFETPCSPWYSSAWFGLLAQLVRALPSHGRGHRFESCEAHHSSEYPPRQVRSS
jgi:hypothetical protein